MRKWLAALCVPAAVAAAVIAVPKALESSAGSPTTLRAELRSYCETVCGSGSLRYVGQREITCALPIVIGGFCVSEGDTVAVGDRIATVDKKATASLIESLGQLPQLAVAAANISTAVALIPDEIRADCAGRVISAAGCGASVESGRAIATVADGDALAVTASISELDLSKVSVGQSVWFTCAAYPDEVFTGTLTAIASAAHGRYSGAVLETVVDVTVTPDAPDERLIPGLSAAISIQLSQPREICVLPYSAIGQDDAGEFVYVCEEDSIVRRSVVTGAEFSDGTEIVSGVTAADAVLSSPEELTANARRQER